MLRPKKLQDWMKGAIFCTNYVPGKVTFKLYEDRDHISFLTIAHPGLVP
jgi:hypothetical protein